MTTHKNRGVGVEVGEWFYEEFLFSDGRWGSVTVDYNIIPDIGRYEQVLQWCEVVSLVVFYEKGDASVESDLYEERYVKEVLDEFRHNLNEVLEFETDRKL